MVPVSALAVLALLAAASDPATELLKRGIATCALRPRPEAAPLDLTDRARRTPSAPTVEIGPPVSTGRTRHVQWLGVVADPVSADYTIRIEDQAAGLVIRAAASNDDHHIFVELDGPGGEQLACAGCTEAPAVIQAERGRGTVQIPSTDRAGSELGPGIYTFRVRAVAIEESVRGVGTTVNVTAAVRTDAPVLLEHVLDLNFVYLPGCSLSEEIATTDPLFAQMLEKVDEWLAPVGICLGRITHNDLDRPEFSVIGSREDAARMFAATSAGVARSGALNVYCVADFDGPPPFNVAIGLSGGIPGPSYSGTRDSGIAVFTPPLFTCNSCLGAFGSLFAHEIGHYLGLYHTTETDFSAYDPIEDTPECKSGQTLDNCEDWLYVMFPAVGDAHDVWSAGQIQVMQGHPLVRTVPVVSRRAAADRTPAAALRAAPNPFRDTVRFEWTAPPATGDGLLSADVYDLAGRRVARLDPDRLAWDGRTVEGAAPAGVYFVRVETSSGARNLRVVKLR